MGCGRSSPSLDPDAPSKNVEMDFKPATLNAWHERVHADLYQYTPLPFEICEITWSYASPVLVKGSLVDVRGIYPKRGSHFRLHGYCAGDDLHASRYGVPVRCGADLPTIPTVPSSFLFAGFRHMVAMHSSDREDEEKDETAYTSRWELCEVLLVRGHHILVRTAIRKYPWPWECELCAKETMQSWIDLEAPAPSQLAPERTRSMRSITPMAAQRFDLLLFQDRVVEIERADTIRVQVIYLDDYKSVAHKESLRHILLRSDARLLCPGVNKKRSLFFTYDPLFWASIPLKFDPPHFFLSHKLSPIFFSPQNKWIHFFKLSLI